MCRLCFYVVFSTRSPPPVTEGMQQQKVQQKIMDSQCEGRLHPHLDVHVWDAPATWAGAGWGGVGCGVSHQPALLPSAPSPPTPPTPLNPAPTFGAMFTEPRRRRGGAALHRPSHPSHPDTLRFRWRGVHGEAGAGQHAVRRGGAAGGPWPRAPDRPDAARQRAGGCPEQNVTPPVFSSGTVE
jgi:hypothetical protein